MKIFGSVGGGGGGGGGGWGATCSSSPDLLGVFFSGQLMC